MTQNEINSGKGLTRVQIAKRAWEKAQKAADAAKARLDKAIADEAVGGGSKKKAEAEAKRIEKAKAILVKAGIEVGK